MITWFHERRTLVCAIVSVAFWALTCHAAASSRPMTLPKKILPLIGKQDAVIVSASDGTILVDIHADRLLVPASILKILTSLAALEMLACDFRFKTGFYIDAQNNLKIKGYGDPLLVSEQLNRIGAQLAAKLPEIQNIVLDDTYFDQPIYIPGRGTSTEPYDAPNGALCVNFNTVAFARKNGHWVTGEPQTPLLNSVIPKIEASGISEGRITLVASSAEAIDYTGALFRYFLNLNGVKIMGGIKQGRVNRKADRLVWEYQSESNLCQTVAQLLEFSNNFIANQILLVLGAQHNSPPATVEKGLAVLRTFYHETLNIPSGKIAEASGISRRNRISARAMLKIVAHFAPYRELMRKTGRQYYKTGHLKGIRTRAGFIASANGGYYRFVVMLNTPGKSTRRIMQVLEKALH